MTASTYTGRAGNPFEALKFGSLIVRCDHGITTLETQLDNGRTPLAISGMLARVRLDSAGTVFERSAVRPRSSGGETR